MGRALVAEIIKLRRSRLTWIAALVLIAAPALAATVVSAMSDPARAEALGLTPEIMRDLGEPGWTMMYQAVAEILAGGFGTILFPILAASLFVREYASGTIKVMLTLPVRRADFVIAKFVTLAGWVGLLMAYLYAISTVLLLVVGRLGAPTAGEALGGALLFAQVGVLIYLGLSVPCLLATFGRGYLPPMVFVGVAAVLGVALAGSPLAASLVWLMPSTHAAAISVGDPSPLTPLSWAIAVLTFTAGAVATWARVRFFDAPR